MVLFNNVTIIGVGLIGGSLAKVLKAKGLARTITGSGRSRSSLEHAIRLGVIDRIGQGKAYGVEDADLVVLASPVGTFEKIVQEIGAASEERRRPDRRGQRQGNPDQGHRAVACLPGVHYVPGPSDRRQGEVRRSRSNGRLCFDGRRCILTPTARTDHKALESVREVWTAAGAVVLEMDADLHDKVFGAVSHLPHIAAFAMMCAVAELNTGTEDYLAVLRGGLSRFHPHCGKLSGNVEGHLPHEPRQSYPDDRPLYVLAEPVQARDHCRRREAAGKTPAEGERCTEGAEVMSDLMIQPSRGMKGEITLPGDKSISHRSVLFAAIADGDTTINGFLTGEDTINTARAVQALGITVDGMGSSHLVVRGKGSGRPERTARACSTSAIRERACACLPACLPARIFFRC